MGITTAVKSGATALAAATAGVSYGAVFVRLKSTHLGAKIDLLKYSIMGTSNDDFISEVILNPTIAGAALVWVSAANSAIEYAIGAATNTITGGRVLDITQAKQNTIGSDIAENAIRIGSDVAGTAQIACLAVTPLSAGLTYYAAMQVFESI
jgi:hypothetical protein